MTGQGCGAGTNASGRGKHTAKSSGPAVLTVRGSVTGMRLGKAVTSSGTLSRPSGGHCFSTAINNVKPLKGIKQMNDIIQLVLLRRFLAVRMG